VYEFHGWFGLAESTEEADTGGLAELVRELRTLLGGPTWPTAAADIRLLNGQYFLSVVGFVNRRRGEAGDLDDLLNFLARRLPGSWGMLYERDDEMPVPPGPNAFRVRVLARGQVTERLDPFLSPCRPLIDD
jgi:hypothetical protein